MLTLRFPLLSSLVFGALAFSASAVEIVAHRGASSQAPENTLAAFNLAWEQKADADELDTYLTRDGEIVVIHDKTTKRTALGESRDVPSSTLAELRALDFGSLKDPKWKGEKIPLLSEALATIPEGRRMFVEIKCGPEILPRLQEVITAAHKKTEQIVIIGFAPEVVKQAKQRFPQHKVYWLRSYKKEKGTGEFPRIEALIAEAKRLGVDGLNIDSHFPIDSAFVAQVEAAGLDFGVWAVDKLPLAQQLISAGVKSITTNEVGAFRSQLP